MFRKPRSLLLPFAGIYVLGQAPTLDARSEADPTLVAGRHSVAACDFSHIPGAVWWGTQRSMTLSQLAAYLAPVYWFSPDEPLLFGTEDEEVRLPEALPFETPPDAPVVYYQFEEVLAIADAGAPGYTADARNKGNSIIDLEVVGVLSVSFFAYFSSEVGLGAHAHDVEATEFKVGLIPSDADIIKSYGDAGQCDERYYIVVVLRVTAKAHGIQWFWNVVDVDNETKFPMTLLVEEGKHGIATDKNADGYFTPGYDVNRYINDAWGVRDNIRSGALLSGGYQAWMTKVRQPQHRVLPPLPEDSPLWPRFERRVRYSDGQNAVYELRPFPPAEMSADDPGLHHFMKDKEVLDWPQVEEASDVNQFFDWVDAGNVVKSLAISAYTDGDLGFAWVFPLFIVKNMEVGVSGGFLVWRMYLKDENLQDFGWMLMYANSASRWFDTYFALGAEWDEEVVDGVSAQERFFVLETGFKFRVNVTTSVFKFLSALTDFWGFRAGVKNYGFTDIDRLTYVLEIGAGAW